MARLEHGGRLLQAVQHYGIAVHDWLDLSTGINPHAYPVHRIDIPAAAWARLPEINDGLERAAARYYGVEIKNLLPVAGSQAAIQVLPRLRNLDRMVCLSPLYEEHPQAWNDAGHRVARVSPDSFLSEEAPVMLLCHPNNPTARRFSPDALARLARRQSDAGGWLVVDEAFIDVRPELSLASLVGRAEYSGLIVLRSLGKFFGLAGARVGFVLASPSLLLQIEDRLGPWTVPGPARVVARNALEDLSWQSEMRKKILEDAKRLVQLLTPLGSVNAGDLFATVEMNQPETLGEYLARKGILVRRFSNALRFGLPGDESQWIRLENALGKSPYSPEVKSG